MDLIVRRRSHTICLIAFKRGIRLPSAQFPRLRRPSARVRGGYAAGGGYLIRCFFDREEAPGCLGVADGGTLPALPGFTIGRRPPRASFSGVRSLSLDFDTLLFLFLVVIFISLFLVGLAFRELSS